MKKLIEKLIPLLLLLIFVDFIVGISLDFVLESSSDGRYYKINYSLNGCNENIIVLGSSRAETNYVPNVFEEYMGQSCWNAGRGGQGLPFWFAISKSMLSRYSPKMVIINAEIDFLSDNLHERIYDRAGILRPFYKSTIEIRSVIDQISEFESLLMLSRIYAYNSSFYYLFRPLFYKGLDGEIKDKGWKPLDGQFVTSKTNTKIFNDTSPNNIDTTRLFDELLELLLSHGTEVYIVVSPDYGTRINNSSTLEYLRNTEGIHLIDLSNFSKLNENIVYYNDQEHLNREGAIFFTEQVCRQILQNKNSIIKD